MKTARSSSDWEADLPRTVRSLEAGIRDGELRSWTITGTKQGITITQERNLDAETELPPPLEVIVLSDPKWASFGHAIEAYLESRQRISMPRMQRIIAELKEVG